MQLPAILAVVALWFYPLMLRDVNFDQTAPFVGPLRGVSHYFPPRQEPTERDSYHGKHCESWKIRKDRIDYAHRQLIGLCEIPLRS
jgi:hypothetical protein